MPSGLKLTILASSGLAVLLNVVQFANGYRQSSKDAFVPSWAEAAAPATQPALRTATRPALVVTPAPTAPEAPAPAAAPTLGTETATSAAIRLTAAGLKPDFAANYLAVQAKTGTPWQLLAAVHRVETGQSGDTARRSSAGAIGPMQFMPATFAHYAQDGDGDGRRLATDLDDALLSAGNYLRASGADKGKYQAALYNYNHSSAYVSQTLGIARKLGL